MRAGNLQVLAAAALLACIVPLAAHHAISAEFDPSKTITFKGVISKVEWVNPHIFIYVDEKDEAGKTRTWMLQSVPPLFFKGSGLTKNVLLDNKDEVTVSAYPAKDGTPTFGFLLKLTYPDGHSFTMAPPQPEK